LKTIKKIFKDICKYFIDIYKKIKMVISKFVFKYSYNKYLTYIFYFFKYIKQELALPSIFFDLIKKIKKKLNKQFFSFFSRGEDYYSSFTKEEIFNHKNPFVGRKKEVEKIISFINNENERLAVLLGRGGIGKSKFLYELSKNKEILKMKWKILFLKESVYFNSEKIKELPIGTKVLLIVEDIHRKGKEEIRKVFSVLDDNKILSLFKNFKIVVSARSNAKNIIDSTLSEFVFEYISIELNSLEIDDTKKIIENILGSKEKKIISYIASRSENCPLVTIISCNLLATGKIKLNEIERTQKFKRFVLDKFKEDLIKNKSIDKKSDELLGYLSAISPVNIENDNTINIISKLLKESEKVFKTKSRIKNLIEKGLLLKKGRLVKIVPDVLSDHILYELCISENGRPSGFVEFIYNKFKRTHLKNILKNIAELDWREGRKLGLLKNIWERIQKKFRESDLYEKYNLLKDIESISFFQPGYSLKIVKIAINNKNITSDTKGLIFKMNYKDILNQVPPILRQISFHYKHLKECFFLLWDLSIEKGIDGSIETLKKIASYEYNKPVSYNKKVLEYIEDLVNEKENFTYKYTPLDLLKELLKKKGEYNIFERKSVKINWFLLNYQNTVHIRERALELLDKCFSSYYPPKIISKTVEILLDTFLPLNSIYGREIINKYKQEYLNEQLHILKIISKGIRRVKAYPLYVKIEDILKKQKNEISNGKIIILINNILREINKDSNYILYRSVSFNKDLLNFDRNKRNKDSDNRLTRALDLLINKGSTLNIFKVINKIVEEYEIFKENENLRINHMVIKLVNLYPKISFEIANIIIRKRPNKLVEFLYMFLVELKSLSIKKLPSIKENEVNKLINYCLKTNNEEIYKQIALTYSYLKYFSDKDIKIIKKLRGIKNKIVQINVLEAVRKLSQERHYKAKEMILSYEINYDMDIIDTYCGVFDYNYGLSLKNFSREEIKSILKKLIPVKKIDRNNYVLDRFLGFVLNISPMLVLDFFISRLEYYYNRKNYIDNIDEYNPFPYSDYISIFKGISKKKDYEKYLRKVWNLFLRSKEEDYFLFSNLFSLISDKYCERALNEIEKWLIKDNPKNIEGVVLFLNKVSYTFVFNRVVFIERILKYAKQNSKELLEKIESDLLRIARAGQGFRTIGETSSELKEIKEKSKKMVERFDFDNPAYNFYRKIFKYAKEEIKRVRMMDEELDYE